MNKKLAIIGAGNMGSAMYKSALGIFPKKQIIVCDANPEKLDALKGARSAADANTACKLADVIVLAVKPQSFAGLCESITISLKDKLIISIMAGISAKMISEKLLASKIIRAMPNLAVQHGAGVIGWIASSFVTQKEKMLARKFFSSLGKEIEVKKENMLDCITTLSGSGPAYFFYLASLLETKARKMGFSENEARLISEQTLIGSAKLLEASAQSARQLQDAVTSKGGTTEAALSYLKEHGFDILFYEALDKAKKRAMELR